jgi:hypothetical protein
VANYGSGYAIDVMREALVKVWGEWWCWVGLGELVATIHIKSRS